MAPNVNRRGLKDKGEGEGKTVWFPCKESWLVAKEEPGQQICKTTLTQSFQIDMRYEFIVQDLKHELKTYNFQQAREREHQRESQGGCGD